VVDYTQYTDYIKRASGLNGSIPVAHFITDWDPIGEQLIADMVASGDVMLRNGRLYVPILGDVGKMHFDMSPPITALDDLFTGK
jgi:hypothetical protein